MSRTLGFHKNYNLNLQRLSSALRYIQLNPRVTYSDLAGGMGVNYIVAESFSAWLRHTGLAVSNSNIKGKALAYELTPFGELVVQYDPFLNDIGTEWVLHYYLSTEHAERSEAWQVFVNQFLTPGQHFTGKQFKTYFASVVGLKAKNKSALTKDPQSVLYTYTNPQSLSKLGLLRKEKQNYIGNFPFFPHILVVGYMLLDWWQRRYAQTDTLSFSQLCYEEGSLGRICQADAGQVKRFIAELTNMGYVNFAETQHEPVNRLYRKPPFILLEKYYQQR